MKVLHDPGNVLPVGDAAHREATPAEVAEIDRRIETGLRRGALAVGMGIVYTPAATRWEILEVFRLAAKDQASVHVHLLPCTLLCTGNDSPEGEGPVYSSPALRLT